MNLGDLTLKVYEGKAGRVVVLLDFSDYIYPTHLEGMQSTQCSFREYLGQAFHKFVELRCPECGRKLAHFSGLEQIPEFFYCPECNDRAYDDRGEVLFLLA